MVLDQDIFLFHELLPVPDGSITTIDMPYLQRPTKKRYPVANPLQSNLFRMELQMQLGLEKLPYVSDALHKIVPTFMNQYKIINISPVKPDTQIVLDEMIK